MQYSGYSWGVTTSLSHLETLKVQYTQKRSYKGINTNYNQQFIASIAVEIHVALPPLIQFIRIVVLLLVYTL